MTQTENEEATVLLLKRVLICPTRRKTTSEDIETLILPFLELENYRPMRLYERIEECEVIFYAEAGIAMIDNPNDTLKAIYIVDGWMTKNVESMNSLRSYSTIDFEGVLRIGFSTEQIVMEIDERTGTPKIVENSTPSEPVPVIRIDGEQSNLFSRVEQVSALFPATQEQTFNDISQVEFEELTRFDVSTRSETEPNYLQESDIESAVLLGKGVLIWPSRERHLDRYGFIKLKESEDVDSAEVRINTEHVGIAGCLACQIVETRTSPMEDHFRGIIAETPKIGEIIVLGNGTLYENDDKSIGIVPEDDREIDWLNPKALYRCHLQTVRLFFLQSDSQDS